MHTSAIHKKATEGNFRGNCRRYALSEYSVLYFKIVRPFPLQMAHFYTGVCVPVCVLYEANSPDICMSGFLHRFVPYKGPPQPIAPLFGYLCRAKPPYDYNHTEVKLSYGQRAVRKIPVPPV